MSERVEEKTATLRKIKFITKTQSKSKSLTFSIFVHSIEFFHFNWFESCFSPYQWRSSCDFGFDCFFNRDLSLRILRICWRWVCRNLIK